MTTKSTSDTGGRRGALSALSADLAELAARTMPSVVSLHAIGTDFTRTNGSGFLIDDDGHLVTNHHVVEGFTDAMRGRLPNSGAASPLRLVGTDPMTDLAVFKLDEHPRDHLEWRESPPRLGELCVAFGSPLGLYPESVSLGIVSGLSRDVILKSPRPHVDAIQTDAAINPGNSGGALVDTEGLVIGVNQAREMGVAQGLSFAIPVEIATYVVSELLSYGVVERAALGVSVATVTRDVEGSPRSCVAVTRVRTVRPGGLRPEDVLLSVGGKPIADRGDLFLALSRELIGKSTEIQVMREGRRVTVTVTPDKL